MILLFNKSSENDTLVPKHVWFNTYYEVCFIIYFVVF